jgi:hypothetical protein
MTRVTDARHGLIEVPPGRVRVAAGAADLGTLLAVDTLRRLLELRGQQVTLVDVPPGWEDVNVHPGSAPGPADVVLRRSREPAGPPYGLEHRLVWLAGGSPEQARTELAGWRADVARWAEEPSKPMCAEVVENVLAALDDDLATDRAVRELRRSRSLGLPPGCLFETWAWADRLLGLDLARDVGR